MSGFDPRFDLQYVGDPADDAAILSGMTALGPLRVPAAHLLVEVLDVGRHHSCSCVLVSMW